MAEERRSGRGGERAPGAGDAGFGYMPQLDGLRAFAAASVLVCHFAPQGGRVLAAFRWGEAGVQLFFVLSGFLITGILLRVQAAARSVGQPTARTLHRFYGRRFLRILPPYYGLLAVGALADVDGFRAGMPWHLTWTTNVWLALREEWRDNVFHFWTLAVEEQFYLAWPCVVLFAPRRWLVPTCLAAIAAGVLYRVLVDVAVGDESLLFVLPIANADTLAAGAMLAVLAADPATRPRLHRLLDAGRRVGVPLLVGTIVLRNVWGATSIEGHVWRLALVLVGPWLVFGAARGFGGAAGRLLGARPIVHLGRVSYGVYLYHVLAPVVVAALVARLGLSGLPWPLEIAAWVGVTVAAALVSWHGFEAPIARRRRRIAYVVADTGAGT